MGFVVVKRDGRFPANLILLLSAFLTSKTSLSVQKPVFSLDLAKKLCLDSVSTESEDFYSSLATSAAKRCTGSHLARRLGST